MVDSPLLVNNKVAVTGCIYQHLLLVMNERLVTVTVKW